MNEVADGTKKKITPERICDIWRYHLVGIRQYFDHFSILEQ
jgi:hypothetical protein